MNTAPIINSGSISASGAAANKANAPSSPSGQSFGQVLSREVSDRNNASNASNAQSNGNVSSGQTDSSSSSGSATNATANTNTNTNTKPGSKTKQAADASAAGVNTNAADSNGTAPANSNGSAQILALVANVQQTDFNNSTSASTSDATDSLPIGQLAGPTGVSAKNASNNIPTQTAAEDGSDATNPDAALADATAGSSLPTATAELKNIKLANSTTQQANSTTQQANSTTQQANSTTQSATTKLVTGDAKNTELEQPVSDIATNNAVGGSAGQPALDLGATSEKNIQTGLSALDANATKTTQPTPDISPTAVPQQVALVAQALPSNPGDKLTPQVGSPGWDQALGQKVVWMVAGGQQSASLTLNPPDLGPLQVVLNVSNSHATATFTAAQPEARQALEAAMPKLREMLGDVGIQLGQTSVNSGAAQQQNTAGEQNAKHSNASRFGNTIDTGDTSIAVSRTTSVSAGLGLVDTFA
jgi:flagellar hook-length control protein FliK